MPAQTILFRVCKAPLAICLAVLLSGRGRATADGIAGPLEVEPEELRPGLLATYQSLSDKDSRLSRIDPKPAFYLGHSSIHPRIASGPFEAVWTGVLVLRETAPISFDAYVGGEVTMVIDGITVLEGRGLSATARVGSREALNRPPGIYSLKIRYRSLPDVPARLQIWWQGASFAREPLPAWQLKHLAAPSPRTPLPRGGGEGSHPAPSRPTPLPPGGGEESGQGRSAAWRFGCARCHADAFPGCTDPPPGPALVDVGHRLSRTWLLNWLDEPSRLRPGAHMPALFTPDRKGFVERWAVTEYLLGGGAPKRSEATPAGDHRAGRHAFVSLGCIACHWVPDLGRAEQLDLDRFPLVGLADRMSSEDLAAFLGNPQERYADGRMPRLPVSPSTARDVAAYLLLWSKPAALPAPAQSPSTEEINALARRLKVHGAQAAGEALLQEKHCTACHPGLGSTLPARVPIRTRGEAAGCLSGRTLPRFTWDEATRKELAAYEAVAAQEKYPSPFEERRQLVERAGCFRCHARDSDRPSPLEQAGSTLGGAYLQYLPYQRVPRLTNLHQKYTRSYLAAAVREGVSGLRSEQYSYRMPAFGPQAEALVQALAEADGELPAGGDPPPGLPADPNLATLAGPGLVGFTGYACVACHVWNGRMLSDPDPGAVGPDLTRVSSRIRRDWFDRFLENPARCYPGTPMPAVFPRGSPALLSSVLDGDAGRQRDALWAYCVLGKDAPSPKPAPPVAVTAPAKGEPPLVAQIPIHLATGGVVESICLLYGNHDLLIYDLGSNAPHSFYTGAQLLRQTQGRLRTFTASGTPAGSGFQTSPSFLLVGPKISEAPSARLLHGYDRLADGVRIRWQAQFASGTVDVGERLRMASTGNGRRLARELRIERIPADCALELRSRTVDGLSIDIVASAGEARGVSAGGIFKVILKPNSERAVVSTLRYDLPPPRPAPVTQWTALADAGKMEGALERPGYRAVAYPRPKLASGEDLIMPAAVAVHPRDGRVFVASLKMGEIFVLADPAGDAKSAHFDNYAHGLFQDALAMLAEEDAVYVLHRRNLIRISESRHDGVADRFDRVFALPHGIADTYDYGYGLVRDKTGAFVLTYAPYANTHLPGSGGALRWMPGQEAPQETAFGFRNPLGWCVGPEREIFFTDNQGEWVATNKLSHLVEGRYYGFPNQSQRQHTSRRFAKPAVWIPYGWARSINGVAYDHTGGKFGPFAGQFFLAELMYGGAIIRANVEKVNGEYQGACFPFWGKGLLGPLTLAFDPRGRLWVGGITEPGWMAQPDRGGLFRIDFTGPVPFEIRSIHVLPRGFRLEFTTPVELATARDPASYELEHYRYEYTGAYGSPELDRTHVSIEKVEISTDCRNVTLTTAPLVRDRVYMISASGVRSQKGEPLVHPTGAYTLNEVPAGRK
jgi:glucose/arabinose dehydrogenase